MAKKAKQEPIIIGENVDHGTVMVEGIPICAKCASRIGRERLGTTLPPGMRKTHIATTGEVKLLGTLRLRGTWESPAAVSIWYTKDVIRGPIVSYGGDHRHIRVSNCSRQRGVDHVDLCELPEGSFEVSGQTFAEKFAETLKQEAADKAARLAEAKARLRREEAAKCDFRAACAQLEEALGCSLPSHTVHPGMVQMDTDDIKKLAWAVRNSSQQTSKK